MKYTLSCVDEIDRLCADMGVEGFKKALVDAYEAVFGEDESGNLFFTDVIGMYNEASGSSYTLTPENVPIEVYEWFKDEHSSLEGEVPVRFVVSRPQDEEDPEEVDVHHDLVELLLVINGTIRLDQLDNWLDA